MSATLFQRLLGPAFYAMPEPVRRLHARDGRFRYAGRTRIVGADNALGRLCARLARLPRSADDVPTVVAFECGQRGETWRRTFGDQRMQSRLRDGRDGLLHERLGALHLRFSLHATGDALWWHVAGARAFGVLPLPASWFEHVRCRVSADGDRYTFVVEATLPIAGRVVRYDGWLVPDDDVA